MTFFDARQRAFQWLALLILTLAMWTLAGCGGGGGGGGSSTPAPVVIAGTLQDTKTGIKLGGYVVTVQGTALSGSTGAAVNDLGVFSISGVTPGNIKLVVTDTCGHTIGSPIAVSVGTSSSAGTSVNIGTVTVDLSSNPPAPCFQ